MFRTGLLGLLPPPPQALPTRGILAPDWRSLFGSPEAHGRAEGAIHGALAVPGPAQAVNKAPRGALIGLGRDSVTYTGVSVACIAAPSEYTSLPALVPTFVLKDNTSGT
jgi:hypothetical protein